MTDADEYTEAKLLFVADGEFPASMLLPAMVRRCLTQRDLARASRNGMRRLVTEAHLVMVEQAAELEMAASLLHEARLAVEGAPKEEPK
jgi:hypothetical protein